MNNQTRIVALELKSYLVRDGDDYWSRRKAIVYRSTTEIADAADISAIISHADIAAEQPQDIGLKRPKGPMYLPQPRDDVGSRTSNSKDKLEKCDL